VAVPSGSHARIHDGTIQICGRGQSAHASQSRTHKHFESNERRSGLTWQSKDRDIITDRAKALTSPRLDTDLVEAHRSERRQYFLDHVIFAHTHTTGGDDHVGAHELVFKSYPQFTSVIRDDPDSIRRPARFSNSLGQQER